MSRLESALVGIRPEVIGAWLALHAALSHMEDDGRRPVCTTRPDDWYDPRLAVRVEAADACTWCPAKRPCLVFGEANVETYGVFGGRDFTRTTRKRAAA